MTFGRLGMWSLDGTNHHDGTENVDCSVCIFELAGKRERYTAVQRVIANGYPRLPNKMRCAQGSPPCFRSNGFRLWNR